MKNSKEGLSGKTPAQYPKLKRGTPIELLHPEKDLHKTVLAYLTERLTESESAMHTFTDRWDAAELRVQSYIKKSDFETIIKEANDSGLPPRPLNITVPYIYSTLSSIVTYMMHTFAGRNPIFTVLASSDEHTRAARNMEALLQYNCDHTKLIQTLRQFFWDGEVYGVGIMRTEWETETRRKTLIEEVPRTRMGITSELLGTVEQERVDEQVVFQGTTVTNIDPRNFYPDPKVPMVDVNKRGEYVFWKEEVGKHQLLKEQDAGRVFYVDYVTPQPANDSQTSRRDAVSGGTQNRPNENQINLYFGSVELIPRELGLSDSLKVEKWFFILANKTQIIWADKLKNDHDRHPVAVSEPYTLGYELGQASIADYLGPLQDLMSWYANSRVYNVRRSLNNMFVYNPQVINEKDINAGSSAFRLLPTAIGQDIGKAIQQLNVADVTSSHMQDMQGFSRIADVLSGVNDNLRGVEESDSSRRTASEVRISAQSAASRLADHARLISSQAITDLTTQMCLNYQQFLSEEFFVRVLGKRGAQAPLSINNNSIVGDFTFPTHDGTLPTDRVAVVQVWKELFGVIAPDEQLRQQFDLTAILEWMASESGVKNLSEFKVQVSQGEPSDGQVPLNEIAQNLG